MVPTVLLLVLIVVVMIRMIPGNIVDILLEVLQEDYIRTARAKGLGEFKVVLGMRCRTRSSPSSRSSEYRSRS